MKPDAAQPPLSIGDIVKHRVLGKEKVVVGIGDDRYLCVPREEIREDGRLRPEARVALHHGASLDKVGTHGKVVAIDLRQLYAEEYKQIRRLHRRNLFREEVLPYSLFLLASLLILLAVFSGLESARPHIDAAFFRKVEGGKPERTLGR